MYNQITVPFEWPKEKGFNFFPPGTQRLYDAGKWALYYYPPMDWSFIVIDFPTRWKINHYPGKLKISYIQDVMKSKPCCNQDEE